MAFIGFLYTRVNHTGDVYNYSITLEYYNLSLLQDRQEILANVYEYFYPTWYFLLWLASIFNLDIQYLNFLAGLTIYAAFSYTIFQLDSRYQAKNVDKILFIKMLLIISFVSVFTSYKTLWSFSFLSIGFILLFKNNKKGIIPIIIGAGLHPISWFPIAIFIFSSFFKFKKVYLFISVLIGIFLKQFIGFITPLITVPFFAGKLDSYILGEWSKYRFHDNSEYIKFYLLVLSILFIAAIIIFSFASQKKNGDKFFERYNNFIFFYFSISLWFISFRTIETRLLLDGVIFFFPLFYQVFQKRKVFLRERISVLVLVLWFLLIDFRIFHFTNIAYKIGSGFPLNLIESPITLYLERQI